LLLLLLVCTGDAPRLTADPPSGRGTHELEQLLIKLHTTARLMHTVAHPDDEDGGMLVLEARGEGLALALGSVVCALLLRTNLRKSWVVEPVVS
jgi:hypothetical protein